jgi:ParB-like chromosome segregation protein Spo0J
MPAIYVDTLEDWLRVRESLSPVYITSKTHGRVLVPCANTVLVKTSLVVGNVYNPNSVPADRLELLRQSILDNGFLFPVVAIWDDDLELFVIIDGFHRRLLSDDEWLGFDYIPVVVLAHDITRRMAATWQLNKAKGVHQVDLDAEVIRALIEQGVAEEEICQKLGIDLDTVHRYKQVTGVAELFARTAYSPAWGIEERED